jgi:ketosteroid isomerase-like protein
LRGEHDSTKKWLESLQRAIVGKYPIDQLYDAQTGDLIFVGNSNEMVYLIVDEKVVVQRNGGLTFEPLQNFVSNFSFLSTFKKVDIVRDAQFFKKSQEIILSMWEK